MAEFGGIREDRNARRLKPVDADGLLEALLVLETDVDEVAALEHLARGLGEARLVAVKRRHCGQARQEDCQAKPEKQQAVARAHHLVPPPSAGQSPSRSSQRRSIKSSCSSQAKATMSTPAK